MKNKTKLNIILFIINVIFFIGIIILEKSHLCGFNQDLPMTCSYSLVNFINILHRFLTYIYFIILIVNILLSILRIIKEKKKIINYVILFVSAILLFLNLIITIYNYNQPVKVDKPIIYIYPD